MHDAARVTFADRVADLERDGERARRRECAARRGRAPRRATGRRGTPSRCRARGRAADRRGRPRRRAGAGACSRSSPRGGSAARAARCPTARGGGSSRRRRDRCRAGVRDRRVPSRRRRRRCGSRCRLQITVPMYGSLSGSTSVSSGASFVPSFAQKSASAPYVEPHREQVLVASAAAVDTGRSYLTIDPGEDRPPAHGGDLGPPLASSGRRPPNSRGILGPRVIQGWIMYSTGGVQPTCNHTGARPEPRDFLRSACPTSAARCVLKGTSTYLSSFGATS